MSNWTSEDASFFLQKGHERSSLVRQGAQLESTTHHLGDCAFRPSHMLGAEMSPVFLSIELLSSCAVSSKPSFTSVLKVCPGQKQPPCVHAGLRLS